MTVAQWQRRHQASDRAAISSAAAHWAAQAVRVAMGL
jgi:hypothetical protein